ncbi:MAG: hypothetical protein A2096_09835 [Spirochaetes bacterium GWF1_41_5]|nr:MAG: hypothetical protein A2096_09835 [Spirochaetes bacterium GWF1_41_5]HBE01073.1 hypothetical protein [Spirochaetia bacterium]
MRMPDLHGVFVPLLTPIFENGEIDHIGLFNLAKLFLSLPYVNGLLVLGTTGEYAFLDYEKKIKIIETVSQIPGNKKPVIINASANDQNEEKKIIRNAAQKKFSAVCLVLPAEIASDMEKAVYYIQTMHLSGFPFVLYWPPALAAKPSCRLLEKIINIPEFVGLKDSSRDMAEFTRICAGYSAEISIFQGVESLYLPSLAVGCTGIIGGGFNLYPRLAQCIKEAFDRHDLGSAICYQEELAALWERINEKKTFRSVCKQYWKTKGIIAGTSCLQGDNIKIQRSEYLFIDSITEKYLTNYSQQDLPRVCEEQDCSILVK